MKYTRAKGTRDFYGSEMQKYEIVQDVARFVCEKHNLKQIKTPVFESTELFKRSVGDESDIVTKEMYTFLDKGNRSITLRPELTAGVVRSYIENGFSSLPSPLKLFYIGNMYRYEKMQKGRYREFSQFGVEIFGSSSVKADIETILIANDILKELNIFNKIDLKINSIGCKECRKEYVNKILDYLKDDINDMCEDCQNRYKKNPLRIIDCKKEKCQNIIKDMPMITDSLCEDCKKDFDLLKENLDKLNVKYTIDPTIVRGLDYYNKTVFEYISKDLGIAVGGGGRYDTLVEILGGSKTSAVGFALGVDRLMMLLEKIYEKENLIYVIADDIYNKEVYDVIEILRKLNFRVEFDVVDRSFGAQMKYANKINSDFVIILKEQELKDKKFVIKDMKNSKEEKCKLNEDSIIEYFYNINES